MNSVYKCIAPTFTQHSDGSTVISYETGVITSTKYTSSDNFFKHYHSSLPVSMQDLTSSNQDFICCSPREAAIFDLNNTEVIAGLFSIKSGSLTPAKLNVDITVTPIDKTDEVLIEHMNWQSLRKLSLIEIEALGLSKKFFELKLKYG